MPRVPASRRPRNIRARARRRAAAATRALFNDPSVSYAAYAAAYTAAYNAALASAYRGYTA